MQIKTILKQLGLKEEVSEVYAYVLSQKQVSARQIASALSLSRPSAYDHLKVLIREGLVVERDLDSKKYFSADDPKKVLHLLEEKKQKLTEGKQAFEAMLPHLSASISTDPKIKFYSGKECFRQVLTEVLLEEPKEVLALWPLTDMTRVVGEEYLQTFTKRRVRDGVRVRAIWPQKHSKTKLSIPAEETRYAPKGAEWRMGSLIYGNKVSFIASLDESFCFTVSSGDFSELMKTQFEVLWGLSKRQ